MLNVSTKVQCPVIVHMNSHSSMPTSSNCGSYCLLAFSNSNFSHACQTFCGEEQYRLTWPLTFSNVPSVALIRAVKNSTWWHFFHNMERNLTWKVFWKSISLLQKCKIQIHDQLYLKYILKYLEMIVFKIHAKILSMYLKYYFKYMYFKILPITGSIQLNCQAGSGWTDWPTVATPL